MLIIIINGECGSCKYHKNVLTRALFWKTLSPVAVTPSCISSPLLSWTQHSQRIRPDISLATASTHTHTTVLQPSWILSGTTRVSRHQKGKTRKVKPIWIEWSGISWAICKSAPWPRHTTMPTSHHSVFTGQMPFLPPNQQHQSTEGTALKATAIHQTWFWCFLVIREACSNSKQPRLK